MRTTMSVSLVLLLLGPPAYAQFAADSPYCRLNPDASGCPPPIRIQIVPPPLTGFPGVSPGVRDILSILDSGVRNRREERRLDLEERRLRLEEERLRQESMPPPPTPAPTLLPPELQAQLLAFIIASERKLDLEERRLRLEEAREERQLRLEKAREEQLRWEAVLAEQTPEVRAQIIAFDTAHPAWKQYASRMKEYKIKLLQGGVNATEYLTLLYRLAKMDKEKLGSARKVLSEDAFIRRYQDPRLWRQPFVDENGAPFPAEIQAQYFAFNAACPDWKRYAPKMLEYGAKLLPGETNVTEYLMLLHWLAKMDAKEGLGTAAAKR